VLSLSHLMGGYPAAYSGVAVADPEQSDT
jgi:hypothetical protein